jgi:hypothetical protein
LDGRGLHLINNALMVLLKKNANAEAIKDFRSISLIKVLSNRLAVHLEHLDKPNQSAFIKGRQLHDNFRAVQLSTRLLHARRRPTVPIKVDIAKAFDTVSWVFLLDILHHMGFGHRWTMILSSASTKILLNSVPGHRICHGRGLRQGDPLSPMLFVLAMEALNGLIVNVDTSGLLQDLNQRAIRSRVSIYADDVVLFLSPCQMTLWCSRPFFSSSVMLLACDQT